MKTEWKKVRLGEICDYVTSGGTPLASRNDYYNPPVIPWLKTKEVNYSRITKTENFISQKGLDNSSAKLIPENSVIIAMYGQGDTAGRVAINKIPLTTNQACCNFIIDKEKADYNFIYYQLCTLYDKMVSLKSGGAQPNLNAGKLKELEISLPPLETQQKIAEILSAYDDLIENNRKQIKLLEEAAQKLYKEWFVKLNFPGHENVKIVEGVPEGWKKEKLGNLLPIVTGKKDANYGTKDGKYPFFTCSQEPIKAPDFSFDANAILLAGNGDLNVKIYRGQFEAYQRTYVLVPYESKYLFICYRTIQDNLRKLVHGASGSTIKFITKGMIESIEVLIPHDDILKSYNDLSESILSKIEILQNQIQLLQSARDKLLPRLMNGGLEV